MNRHGKWEMRQRDKSYQRIFGSFTLKQNNCVSSKLGKTIPSVELVLTTKLTNKDQRRRTEEKPQKMAEAMHMFNLIFS